MDKILSAPTEEYFPSAPIEETNPSAPEQEFPTTGCKILDMEKN